MSTIQNMISSLIDSIKNTGEKTSAYDTSAEVKRIEGDTAWVHIPGGVDETPVKLTINATEGDTVQVRVNGGRAWLQGNATAPPTDDTTANVAKTIATDAQEEAVRAGKAADAAEAEAVRAGAAADRAEESASDALTAAQSAQTSADSALVSLATVEDVAGVLEWITNHGTMTLTSDVTVNPSHVYFVVDAGGDYVVGSTHYSIVSEPKDSELSTYYELSIDKSIQNYVATHIVIDSEGLWLIPDSGGNKVLIATGAGSSYTSAGTYIIGKVNGVDTVLAQFTGSGAVIGQNKVGEMRSVITNDSMKIARKLDAVTDIEVAEFGYGLGNNSSGGTSEAPYYTIGTRENNTFGNYSLCEGYVTDATAYCAHAEGNSTEANGAMSHAEGFGSVASGFCSHAENYSVANGDYSHAQNKGTLTTYDSQTAIGRYNDNKSGNVFEIGNGTADNVRSNALAVDWSGNVNIPSGAKYKINGTALTASDVGALSSSTTYVSGVKGNSESTYRTGQVNITAANVGAVPTTRTVNSKALSSDISLTASDVGAVPTSDVTTSAENNKIPKIYDNILEVPARLDMHNSTLDYDVTIRAVTTGTSGAGTLRVRCGKLQTYNAASSSYVDSDYIIEQSQATTSYGDGYWRWREWYSGKVEIWYHGYLTLTSADSDRYGVKRYSRWFNFPNSYSLYRCSAIVNGMNDGGWYGCGGLQNASSQVAEPFRKFQVMSYRISSAPPAQADNLNIYICGQKSI